MTVVNKYQRKIRNENVDVYDILVAFNVTNPAIAHAVKKLLMPGQRGGKPWQQDVNEAIQSLHRALELANAELANAELANAGLGVTGKNFTDDLKKYPSPSNIILDDLVPVAVFKNQVDNSEKPRDRRNNTEIFKDQANNSEKPRDQRNAMEQSSIPPKQYDKSEKPRERVRFSDGE
jgi:hypothetical protein